MVTIEQLVTKALAEVQADAEFTRDVYTLIASLAEADPTVSAAGDAAVGRKLVERTVLAVIHGMGFHVAQPSGEVCDPRPQPVAVFNNERNPRFRGVKPGRYHGGRK